MPRTLLPDVSSSDSFGFVKLLQGFDTPVKSSSWSRSGLYVILEAPSNLFEPEENRIMDNCDSACIEHDSVQWGPEQH